MIEPKAHRQLTHFLCKKPYKSLLIAYLGCPKSCAKRFGTYIASASYFPLGNRCLTGLVKGGAQSSR